MGLKLCNQIATQDTSASLQKFVGSVRRTQGPARSGRWQGEAATRERRAGPCVPTDLSPDLRDAALVALVVWIVVRNLGREAVPEGAPGESPPVLRQAVLAMTEAQRETFLAEYKRKRKSPLVTWILTLLLGLHYVYLGRWGKALLFWVTFGGIFMWWLLDLCRPRQLTNEVNADIASEVLRTVGALAQMGVLAKG